MTWWLPWHPDWQINAGVLLLALVLDIALPEPPNVFHPVAWMGKVISWMERLAAGLGNTMSFLVGVFMAVSVPVLFGGAAWLAAIGLREIGDIPYLIGCAILLKTTFAVRGLGRAARDTQRSIESADISDARQSLRSLVSRDAAVLSEPLVAAAAIESVAENTTDSFIAPWFAFALLGLPGAFAYRAVNTLDSMIGYRGKYEYLGKASARIDDVLNLIPARIATGLLLLAGLVTAGCSARRGWRTALREHRITASPNAGWTIAAAAGLLGVALEKPGHYCIGSEYDEPVASDIGKAARLMYVVAALGVVVAVGVIAALGLWAS